MVQRSGGGGGGGVVQNAYADGMVWGTYTHQDGVVAMVLNSGQN